MAAVLVSLQLFTGILLKFAYEPVPTQAYASLVRLQDGFLFGQLVRSIHFWSANLLVVVVCLHGLRVFFTGGFHPPRRLNWLIGLCLLILVLASNLTGYLLPWDQLAYWATIICVSMLEYVPFIGSRLQQLVLCGPQIGPATLRGFYAMHTAVFPVLIVMLMAFHFWRVRKAGGLVIPRSQDGEPDDKPAMVPAHPDLLLREAALASATIAAVLILSLLYDAPLGQPANPGLSPNPTKAPWYFAGVQELLMHFHPSFALLITATLLIAAFYLPYINYRKAPSGVWFASVGGRRTARAAAMAAAVVTPLVIVLDVNYWIATDRRDLTAEQIAEAYKQRWNIENFFAWWKRHMRVYHLIARSRYGLMVQILAGLITYLLLAIHCHTKHGEPVSIKRVRELRIDIQNELRIAKASPDPQIYKEPEQQNLYAST